MTRENISYQNFSFIADYNERMAVITSWAHMADVSWITLEMQK